MLQRVPEQADDAMDALFLDAARVAALERENQRLRRAVEELSVLNEVAREIGAARETDTVMETIVRQTLQAVQAEQGLITLVDPAQATSQRTLVRRMVSSAPRQHFHVHESLMGWMYQHKRPLFLQDPQHDARFRGLKWDAGIQSVLSVPLLIKSALTGVLTVFNKKGDGSFSQADQRLLSILAAQSAQVIENARLWEEEQALQRLRSDLDVARTIQTRLLPSALPTLPGYDLAATSRPAQVVGGDFYDVVPIEPGRLALCVGDVSGKGLPAALTMANVQAILRSQLRWGTPVDEALRRANQLLYESTDRRTFVTLFASIFDARQHTLQYANAGHNRPLWRTAGDGPQRLEGGGLALGLQAQATYRAATVSLTRGDVLLIYSDGLTEAMNHERREFGEAGLQEVFGRHAAASAEAILHHLLEAVQRHTHGAAPTDDTTLLVLKRA